MTGASAGNLNLDCLLNSPFRVGGTVVVGRTEASGTQGNVGTTAGSNGWLLCADNANTIPSALRITDIEIGQIVTTGVPVVAIYFDRQSDEIPQVNTNALAVGNPICAGLYPKKAPSYSIDNLQLTLNVVDAQPAYLEKLVKESQSGKTSIAIDTMRDIRVNVSANATQNEIFIPCNLDYVYSMIVVPENLDTIESYLTNNFNPPVRGLNDYVWNMDGHLIPTQRIDLSNISQVGGGISPLQQLELEKALDESPIQMRDMRNPYEYFCLGRRMGSDGESVSLNGKTTKLRINYTSQPNNLLFHFLVYHRKHILIEGGQLVIEQ